MKRLLIILFAVIVSFLVGMCTDQAMTEDPIQVVVRTDTIVRVDTFMVNNPVAYDSVEVKYITRYLPVHTENSEADPDEDECVCDDDPEDTDDPPSTDSICVDVPITQHVYGDDRYKAWVSGYEARLDSIEIYSKSIYIEKEIVKTKRQSRWGCVAGAGFGVGKDGFTPMVGVTIGYRLF